MEELETMRGAACDRLRENPAPEQLWAALSLFQNCPFRTARDHEFTYTIRGGELFVSRKEKSVTRSSVDMALKRVLELGGGSLPARVSGPKKLGVFGASYLYPIFARLGMIQKEEKQEPV